MLRWHPLAGFLLGCVVVLLAGLIFYLTFDDNGTNNVASAPAPTPPAAATPDCLAYLAADRAFHEKRVAASPIFNAVRDALDTDDEARLQQLEAQDKGRWKVFIERWRTLEKARWRTAYEEAVAARDAAWNDYQAISPYALSSTEAKAASDGAWNDWKAADDVAQVAFDVSHTAHDVALTARETAYKEAWGYEAAAARLVAAYVETYAASGHDVTGYDVGLIFKAAAHERQTACPILGISGWIEPLEHLARE